MREASIAAIIREIEASRLSHPLRVAIDGRTACGKTTLADEIADALRRRGRSVIRTSIDGFHRPKAERYARGRNSPEGYYFDARDLTAIRGLLLDPLGEGGDLRYRTAVFDLEADAPVKEEPRLASADDVLIVDGTFLQRRELRSAWDLAVYVDVPEALAATRGAQRDAERLGGPAAAAALYRERYQPAFLIYAQTCDPRVIADIVFDNAVFAEAAVTVQRQPPLAQL
jgi:uridine kinase